MKIDLVGPHRRGLAMGFNEAAGYGAVAVALSSASQAGLVNNLNEGMAWGLFPLYFAARGRPFGEIGLLIAIAPAVWGVGQLFTGGLSDRWGRKWFIAGGQWLEAAGLAITALSGIDVAARMYETCRR